MLMISIIDLPKAQQHTHAHRLLEECLKAAKVPLNGEPALIFGTHGKPSLQDFPELHFNLSHADGIAACMLSRRECGIDCERVRTLRPGVLRRAFSPEEQRAVQELPEGRERDLLFFRLWTLKEAYVKALGVGIAYPLSTAEFAIDGDRIVTGIQGFTFSQRLLRDGSFVVSVCRRDDIRN